MDNGLQTEIRLLQTTAYHGSQIKKLYSHPMVTLQQAYHIITTNLLPVQKQTVSMLDALGQVLAEDLYADRDFPPFNRVTMDGIAIAYPTFEKGQRAFPIAAMAPAGTPQVQLHDSNHCVEVMTGAMLPEGTDTVVRYEDLLISNKVATIQIEKINSQQNVHAVAKDCPKGALLVASGKIIGPPEIGIAATIGKSQLQIIQPPRTVVISTGDELVEVNEVPEAHQIRRSNVYNIMTALKTRGIIADQFHLNDDRPALVEKLGALLQDYEVLILSGGVSMGKFDYVPDVLTELGIAKLFHGVQQRPGKPFWFGTNGKQVVFALPGNPVSSYMCTIRYIQPWFDKTMGLPEKAIPYATLTHDFTFKPDLTYLLQVKVSFSPEGQILATPVEGGGSGDLANLEMVDAFMELPRGKELFKKGEAYPLFLFRHL
jgi:molybdopterin molybdotransferase